MNSFYILIALQIADVVTTIVALSGPAHEANPILKKIMDAIGVVPALVLIKGAAVAFFWFYQAMIPKPVFWMLCAFYVYIVYNNIVTIKKGMA